MSTRAEKINDIIAKRKPHVEKTAKTIEQLRQLESSLSGFAAFLTNTKEKVDAEYQEKISRLQGDLAKLTGEQVLGRIKELNQLLARFDRSTFNVGVTGNAGIGKSTLLQHLTGLPNDLIPARDPKNPMGGSCTGAPSVIVNNIANDRIYADIEFYQESDFFDEIIKPYYEALDKDQSWLRRPSNFNNFANSPLPPLPAKFDGNTRIRNIYDALKYRQEHAKQYQREFGRRLQNVEDTDTIRKYVAQKDKNNKPIMDWIPVKMVTIYCPFKGVNGERIADRISVCDTPGLGDIGCKADDSLMRNIAENVDAVWMMNLVTSAAMIIKQSDSDLYTLLADAVPEWKPQDWVYGVINKYTGTTSKQAATFREEMKKRYIDVRKVYELDAQQPEEVLATFDSTLEDIANNQQALNESLYQKRMEKVKSLTDRVAAFLAEAKIILPKNAGGSAGIGQLQPEFAKCWGQVTNELNEIVKRYKDMANLPDDRLAAVVDEIKKEQIKYIKEKLQKVTAQDIAAGGGLSHFSLQMMGELRIELSSAFNQLDDLFKSDLTALRQEVYDLFVDGGKGRLGGIIDTTDPTVWFRKLSGRWQELDTKIDDPRKIAQSIEFFVEIAFHFSSLLLPRIREKLNTLDGEQSEAKPFLFIAGDTWEIVGEKLEMAFEKALVEIVSALKKLSLDVNRAKYAVIEQFKDGVTVSGSFEKAKNLWFQFYYEFRAEIWQELFAQFEEDTKLRNDWNRHLSEVENCIKQIV